jgi:hypothetical protein
MKATELMIGDWVYYGKKPVKVLQLSEGKDYKEINPIPLTSEILEKNGFERLGTNYFLLCYPFGLTNPSTHDNYKDNYYLRVSDKSVNIKFVHELQHALRLCGIDKETTI